MTEQAYMLSLDLATQSAITGYLFFLAFLAFFFAYFLSPELATHSTIPVVF